jgi:hypothetical protein
MSMGADSMASPNQAADKRSPRILILILHQNLGSGHKRVGTILEDMVSRELGAEVVNVAANDILRSPLVGMIEWLWDAAVRRDWVKIADCLWNHFLRPLSLPVFDALDAPAFHNKLDTYEPDLILCTAEGYSKGLGAYAAERGIPLQVYITSSSVFIDTVSSQAQHLCYFEETVNAVRAFDLSLPYFSHPVTRASSWWSRTAYVLQSYKKILFRGITSVYQDAQDAPSAPNDAECMTVGPLVSARHFAANKREVVRRRLGIKDSRHCVLVASGSIGGGFLEQVVDTVCAERSSPVTLLVMCGRDETTRQRVEKRGGTVGTTQIVLFGFVEDFEDYLAAADCAVIRPSGGVFNECLVSRTPVVVPARVTSDEHGILTLLKRHGLGEIYCAKSGVAPALDQVLRDKDRYRRNIEVFLEGYPQTYEAMTERIVSAIDDAAQRCGQPPLRKEAKREVVRSG